MHPIKWLQDVLVIKYGSMSGDQPAYKKKLRDYLGQLFNKDIASVADSRRNITDPKLDAATVCGSIAFIFKTTNYKFNELDSTSHRGVPVSVEDIELLRLACGTGIYESIAKSSFKESWITYLDENKECYYITLKELETLLPSLASPTVLDSAQLNYSIPSNFWHKLGKTNIEIDQCQQTSAQVIYGWIN